jgi:nucleotide-binding universal stress UspA family protein
MPTLPYRNILCPVDFSDPSRAAVGTAAEMARLLDAHLTLLHVYQVPVLAYPESLPGSPFRVSIAQLAEKQLAEWKREAELLTGRSVTSVAIEGAPWDGIVKYAHEHRSDLIVVGTQGRTWLAHALIGSVAENVVRHASCPVLVVRAARP